MIAVAEPLGSKRDELRDNVSGKSASIVQQFALLIIFWDARIQGKLFCYNRFVKVLMW